MIVLGYHTVGEKRLGPQRLADRAAVESFLEQHLWDAEVVLTDPADSLLFHARDGVDLYSRLGELDIDLAGLVERVRRRAAAAGDRGDREPWEDMYDSIGLSPGEIAMRQRVKAGARAARTVADVVTLLAGTYFAAAFVSADRSREWAAFDPEDLSADEIETGEDGPGRRVRLHPEARVRHESSGEDRHHFVLIDPPEPLDTPWPGPAA